MVLRIIIGLAMALAASWVVLVVVLVIARPRDLGVRQLAGFVPKLVHLLRALYQDPQVPTSVRWRLWVALVYNIQPFTLIPDFIPVIGFADNVVVTLWALRSAVRKAGGAAVVRHWEGSEAQLALLSKVAHLELPSARHDVQSR